MESDAAKTWSLIFEAVKLAIGPIGAGLGWFAGRWALRRSRKQRRERLIRFLDGLPAEAKAVLVHFHENGTHTMRGDPLDRTIEFLITNGVLVAGVGGGTYDAIDRYLTVRPDVWEVVQKWAVCNGLRANMFPPSPGFQPFHKGHL